MDIYLVIFEKVSGYESGNYVASFTEREEVIKCAADIASSGKYQKYQDDDYYLSDVNLKKIILFDSDTLRGSEYELVLENGRFTLEKSKQKRG